MSKKKKKYKFRPQHSNSTGESAKEQRAKRMIYHDLRTTMLFVFEALICLIIYSTFSLHFEFGTGKIPNQLAGSMFFFYMGVIPLVGLLNMFFSDNVLNKDGKINMDILQKGEYLTSCLYAFSMLFLPFSFIFINIKVVGCIFIVGICLTLLLDFHYGYENPFTIKGLSNNYKPSQMVSSRYRVGTRRGEILISMSDTAKFYIIMFFIFNALAIYLTHNIW
ncbi:MAG: hypothetical protein J5676_09910 [Bacteroidaceae bacterium]|nr:hypothetical protein [Bacteroidaceae bacterium]